MDIFLCYSRLSYSRLCYSRLSYSRLSYSRLSYSRLSYSRLSYSRRASAHAIARNDWPISQGAATGSLLVVARDVVQAVNDKQQIEPLLNQFDALPDEFGDADTLLADTGYFSAANVAACEAAGTEPVIAMGRQPHHPPLGERFCDDPSAPVEAHAGSRRG